MGAFGKAFGTTTGCFAGVVAIILLSCGGCLLFIGVGTKGARDAARRNAAANSQPDAPRPANATEGESNGQQPTSPAQTGESESTPKSNSESHSFSRRTGVICSLSADGEDVFLAADEETEKRLTRLANAKDQYGILELVLAGEVWVIPSGTHARIITPGFLTTEVRILEGEHAGVAGIVPTEWIHPPRSRARPEPSSVANSPEPDPVPPKRPELPANFTVHFKSGKTTEIAAYEEVEGSYMLTGTSGGKGRYPKSLVDRIEPLGESEVRTWKTADGKYSVEAEFAGLQNDAVRLKKSNGKEVSVPLERLSDEDRQYVREQGTPE